MVGNWVPGFRFKKGDVAFYQGAYYQAVADNAELPITAKWKKLDPRDAYLPSPNPPNCSPEFSEWRRQWCKDFAMALAAERIVARRRSCGPIYLDPPPRPASRPAGRAPVRLR